jgi:EpsI family protein
VSSWRFSVVCLLLVGTAILLRARNGEEVLVQRQPLEALPNRIGPWEGHDVQIPEDVKKVLGNGDFLSRLYRDDANPAEAVELFIAYLPSQRFGDTIHSPKNCLPGSGWFPLESSRVPLSFFGHSPFLVNRYVVAKGDARQLVIYWYLAHGRAVASEYLAKYYLLVDSVRMNRSDGSMIRLVTPLRAGESLEVALHRIVALASNVLPGIDRYIPQ